MNKNIAILFSDFGPYHVARMEALADALNKQGDTLYACRFSEASTVYGWKPVAPANAVVITLGTRSPEGLKDAYAVAKALRRVIELHNIQTIFLPSYAPLPNTFCLLGAKMAGCKTVMMNESWRLTERSSFAGKMVKHLLVRMFNSALVGGHPQRQYAVDYGIPEEKVFLGYDAVDVNYFAQQAAIWRQRTAETLPVPNLPKRYFLNLGRFVSKKNLPTLIRAYNTLRKANPLLDIALVLVGEGHEEQNLRTIAAALQLPVREGLSTPTPAQPTAEVVFYPFQQVDITPLFFTCCEAFILPSMYEEWGLVVNEAMACGAAVLVSENVGCAADLVVDGSNGFRFNPASEEQLTELLQQFATDPLLAKRLGEAGSNYIKNWGPERFASGGLQALAAANN